MFRSPPDEDPPRDPGRSWSSRLAWLTLAVIGVVVVARVSVATVVQVHGEGMTPALEDGDYVLLVRDRWNLSRGDIVVYDPSALAEPVAVVSPPPSDAVRPADPAGREVPDPQQGGGRLRRDTAMVDRSDLEQHWQEVRSRSDGEPRRPKAPLRVGRILALPGDTVTFFVDGAELGLAIDGVPLRGKPAGAPPPRGTPVRWVYETLGEQRYPVVRSTTSPPAWDPFRLPPAADGPVDVEARGYLVLADNRDDGACCDSRAHGWISADAIDGKVLFKLSPGRAAVVSTAPARPLDAAQPLP